LKLKFQTVAEKTAKNFRGLLYFTAPGICCNAVTQANECQGYELWTTQYKLDGKPLQHSKPAQWRPNVSQRSANTNMRTVSTGRWTEVSSQTIAM